MNAETRIRELAQTYLADNHQVDGVRFIDELLAVVAEAGKVNCSFSDDHHWRFQVSQAPAWEIELGRAKSKLRMLCARLAVLCNESGGQDVSLYGGEGIITSLAMEHSPSAGKVQLSRAGVGGSSSPSQSPDGLGEPAKTWAVRFKNTPSEQEFTIVAQ